MAGECQLRQTLDHWFANWDRFGKPGIQWKFIPPHSPSQGGNYERLIRSVKEAFYKVIPSQQTLLTDEELGTCFKHLERLVNSRPLTTVSTDPRDPVALTPADFLMGAKDVVVAGVNSPVQCNLRERWKFLQNLTIRLWTEFIQGYIQRLHPREKWPEKENPLREGQIVVLLKPDCPKGHWPLGVITKVFPGPDGQVRDMMVRNSQQELLRRGPSGIAPLANCEIIEQNCYQMKEYTAGLEGCVLKKGHSIFITYSRCLHGGSICARISLMPLKEPPGPSSRSSRSTCSASPAYS